MNQKKDSASEAREHELKVIKISAITILGVVFFISAAAIKIAVVLAN